MSRFAITNSSLDSDLIAAKGKLVKRWNVGERITVPFVCACGTCKPCRTGNEQVCDHQFQPGFRSDCRQGQTRETVERGGADYGAVRMRLRHVQALSHGK